jgi:hypothetical protein
MLRQSSKSSSTWICEMTRDDWVTSDLFLVGVREVGVPTPTFDVMYAALKPYANGAPA